MSARTEGGTALTQLHDLLLESEDIAGFLTEFTAMMAHRLTTGDRELWCAVSLLRENRGTSVASSGPQAKALDETQNKFLDGPCLTAIREHTVVRAGDVRSDGRWPEYLTTAADQGVAAVVGCRSSWTGTRRQD